MTANTYGRQVVLPLTNKSGGAVAAGDVVIVDTTNNDAFTTTTTGAFTGALGVAQETIANNATGRVLLSGYAALVNVNASVTRGHFGKTHTVAKQGTDAGTSRVAGTFCMFLTGGTTPDAVVWQPDLGGAAGTSHSSQIRDVLYDNTLGSDTATWDVSSIDQTYDDLELRIHARSTVAATFDDAVIAFNNDTTGGNYYAILHYSGTGPTNGQDINATPREIANISGATAPSGEFTPTIIDILGYASTTWNKNYIGRLTTARGASSQYTMQIAGDWHSTAAINRITIACSANFKTGSRFQIIGIKTANILIP